MERSTERIAGVAFEGYAAGEALKTEDVDRYLRSYPYVIRRRDGSEATDAERVEAVRRAPWRAKRSGELAAPGAEPGPQAVRSGSGDGNEAPPGLGDSDNGAADGAPGESDG